VARAYSRQRRSHSVQFSTPRSARKDQLRSWIVKKWFQVTRFPAPLSAGMHGTECLQLRAPGASPVSSSTGVFSAGRINALRHAVAFSFSPNWDRKLVTAFRSPATASALADSIPGSMFLACCFASCAAVPEPVRLLPLLPAAVCSRSGSFFVTARCPFSATLDSPAPDFRSPGSRLPVRGETAKRVREDGRDRAQRTPTS
jgi:hypothetical protein